MSVYRSCKGISVHLLFNSSSKLNVIIHQEPFPVNRFCSILSIYQFKVEHVYYLMLYVSSRGFQLFTDIDPGNVLFRVFLYAAWYKLLNITDVLYPLIQKAENTRRCFPLFVFLGLIPHPPLRGTFPRGEGLIWTLSRGEGLIWTLPTGEGLVRTFFIGEGLSLP